MLKTRGGRALLQLPGLSCRVEVAAGSLEDVCAVASFYKYKARSGTFSPEKARPLEQGPRFVGLGLGDLGHLGIEGCAALVVAAAA